MYPPPPAHSQPKDFPELQRIMRNREMNSLGFSKIREKCEFFYVLSHSVVPFRLFSICSDLQEFLCIKKRSLERISICGGSHPDGAERIGCHLWKCRKI